MTEQKFRNVSHLFTFSILLQIYRAYTNLLIFIQTYEM